MFSLSIPSSRLCGVLLFALLMSGGSFHGALRAEPVSTSDIQNLDTAEKYYINGKYNLSTSTLAKVKQEALPKESEALQRYFLLHARLSAVYENDREMRSWLSRLAASFPETKLDYYTDPPQILQAWQELSAPRVQDEVGSSTIETKSAAAPKDSTGNSPPNEPNLRQQSSSIMSLLPFGIGSYHIGEYSQGILFSLADLSLIYYGSKGELPFNNLLNTGPEKQQGRYTLMATSAFIGSWGYQALLTERTRMEGPREEVWFGLSFLPFGVGQLKNGQVAKAFGFGLAQAGLILIAGNTSNEDLANLSYATAIGSMIYGAYDGWFHHRVLGSQAIGLRVEPIFLPSNAVNAGYWVGLSGTARF